MLWLRSALSELCVISSIILRIALIWRQNSYADTIKTTWKAQAHNDIMGTCCLYIYHQEFIILEVEESVQLSIQQPNTLR